MAELVRHQKRLERNTKITAIVNIALCVILVVTFAAVVPKVRIQMDKLGESLVELDQMVLQAEELIGNANAMIVANTDTVTEAMQKLNSIKFDVLNEAIVNLNDTVKPLAEFMKMFQ